jgi:flagellar biosynthesis regulator FlaF
MKSAIAAYQQTRLMVQSTKGLERQLLLQRYAELEQAAAQEDVFVMLQAVASQRELWVTIRALLLDDAHPFPSDLRLQLLELAEIVLAQLQQPLSDVDVELVLAVNLQLAEGLGSD